jgi:pyridoxamine 5'-phosphate oxidase
MKIKQSLGDLRLDYTMGKLLEANCPKDPFELFDFWFKEAAKTETEPNAMSLATATLSGKPSNRIVLLKGYRSSGFLFYTNYESKKGKELIENPLCALNFWWGERAVRVQGSARKVSCEESDAYFKSRPKGSQIGAWVSSQSTVINSREELEQREVKYKKLFENEEIKRPEFWGGFEVVPESIEFWQGRPCRLHDRIRYKLYENKEWQMERLCP